MQTCPITQAKIYNEKTEWNYNIWNKYVDFMLYAWVPRTGRTAASRTYCTETDHQQPQHRNLEGHWNAEPPGKYFSKGILLYFIAVSFCNFQRLFWESFVCSEIRIRLFENLHATEKLSLLG